MVVDKVISYLLNLSTDGQNNGALTCLAFAYVDTAVHLLYNSSVDNISVFLRRK